jgi:glycosyltransferase involved in cell wall biosynthesis
VTRVLMTADAMGGVWQYALELARALAAHDHEIVLAVTGPAPSASQRRQARSVPRLRLEEASFRLEWMDGAESDLQHAGDWLLELAERWAPDLVHVNGFAVAALPWEVPVVCVAHSERTSWQRAVRGAQAPPARRAYREGVAAGLDAADAVAAPSAFVLDELERDYGRPAHAVVIPHGRSAASCRVGAKSPLVLGVGRLWDEGKNLGALAAVAGDLPWPVVLVGETAAPGGFTQVRAPGALALGRREDADVAGWLARSAIFALPARYEPFGLAALEAGLSGCALVLGDLPSLREVWGDAACFVAPDDLDGLRLAIWELARDACVRDHFSRAARRRALEFKPERMARAYLDLYRAAADRRARCDRERLASSA